MAYLLPIHSKGRPKPDSRTGVVPDLAIRSDKEEGHSSTMTLTFISGCIEQENQNVPTWVNGPFGPFRRITLIRIALPSVSCGGGSPWSDTCGR